MFSWAAGEGEGVSATRDSGTKGRKERRGGGRGEESREGEGVPFAPSLAAPVMEKKSSETQPQRTPKTKVKQGWTTKRERDRETDNSARYKSTAMAWYLLQRPGDRYAEASETMPQLPPPPWAELAAHHTPSASIPAFPSVGPFSLFDKPTAVSVARPPPRPWIGEEGDATFRTRTAFHKGIDSAARLFCSHRRACEFALLLVVLFVVAAVAMEGYYRCWKWLSDPLGAAVIEYRKPKQEQEEPARGRGDDLFASVTHVQLW
jgi:hypothetical protein